MGQVANYLGTEKIDMSGVMNYLDKLGQAIMNGFSAILNNIGSIAATLAQVSSMFSNLNKSLSQENIYNYNTHYTYNYHTYNNDMKSSYTINDTSGEPESVASTVDRTKQMQLRNLQGILGT